MSRCLRPLIVMSVLTLPLARVSSIEAAPNVGPQGDSAVSAADLYYDYELWIAWDVVRYYVVAEFGDGHTEQFQFDSEAEAEDFIAWLAFHILDFAGAEIVEQVQMGPWTYYDTYDAKLDAENVAALAVSLGFYAKVVPVNVIRPALSR